MKTASLAVLASIAIVLVGLFMTGCASAPAVPPNAACEKAARLLLTDAQGHPAKARHLCFDGGHVYYADRILTLDELAALNPPPSAVLPAPAAATKAAVKPGPRGAALARQQAAAASASEAAKP